MSATMAKNKPTDRHKGETLTVRIPADMKEALRRYARRERRSMTQGVLLLLEEILQAKELWKPPSPPDQTDPS